ncbi:SDR family NAD(P)-dependent oxidoreductase [Microbacterium sp. NPDC058389]|uniref:SDR family NAD(P)-dependent oxidoreductase n=1 Tax=Microbacterium sp. NPDC058389 TaxID=3346475 RepID=UPI0036547299
MEATHSNTDPLRLDGRVAIVTGAARGQGRRTAEILAARGAHVLVADIDITLANAVADEIGSRAASFQLDITRPDQWQMCVEAARQFSGRPAIDIVVNNAAKYVPQRAADATVEDFRNMFEINVCGVVNSFHAVTPGMKAQRRGSIVNIASVAGISGRPGAVTYATSKWALRGLSKIYAAELAEWNVRVNCVLPGLIDTPMAGLNSPEHNAAVIASTPLGRLGTVGEVAEVNAFLASDAASYLTGSEITVDGGTSL